MRFAIFSDVHANLEALEAVLADANENKCTHFVCLGDVVGYNANPHECVERIREMDCPIVKGNHDEQASLFESSRDFNEMAEAAIQWTRDNLTDADKEWLRALYDEGERERLPTLIRRLKVLEEKPAIPPEQRIPDRTN